MSKKRKLSTEKELTEEKNDSAPKYRKSHSSISEESVSLAASDTSMPLPLMFQMKPNSSEQSVSGSLAASDTSMPLPLMFHDDQMKPDRDHHSPVQTYSTENEKNQPSQHMTALETGDSELSDTIKKHKNEMHSKFSLTFEGKDGRRSSLNHVFVPLSIIMGNSERPQEHECRLLFHQLKQHIQDIEVNLSDIFEISKTMKPRTVLTKGVAGIGKSFSVQKFIVDWAEDKTIKDIHFVFSLAFRELNMINIDKSFLQLVKDFHPALSHIDPMDFVRTKVMIILDGLDESRFHLDFRNTKRVSSVEEVVPVTSLITNLIQGSLLPSAQLWITSRPGASFQIPAEFIHRVTEIQGFNDQQKEKYFKKKFNNKPDITNFAISHIQSSPTLDLLCQIPIFCWMYSLLLEDVFGEDDDEPPQTLTELMAHFLFVQTKRSSLKYDQEPEKDSTKLLKVKREFLLKLGKLALILLLKNTLIFYEEDLQHCGFDPNEATVNSGFFNTILREEQLFSQKVYFFVHLTVQEFFAAVYVFDCFTNNNTWAPELNSFLGLQQTDQSSTSLFDLLKMAVDRVLEKNSSHLSFFLRFLLGLVVEANQRCLRGLLVPHDSSQDTVKQMLFYLKTIRRDTVSPDACINLFKIMVEMRDTKTNEDIEEYLKSEDRSHIELSPMHCSALAFTIQVSKSVLVELDLKSFNTSQEGRRRLIPAIRRSCKANLSDCQVPTEWLKHLSVALIFPHSPLKDLDLSNNDLGDSGVQHICEGLKSHACKLSILRLSGCLVTEKGCSFLVLALKSNPSHLKELDLSYNHLGSSGVEQLNLLKNDPQYSLSHLDVSHGESHRIIPGLKKYSLDFTWDTKQAHKSLQFSDDNRKVSWAEEGPGHGVLVLGGQRLDGRCYWEIETTRPCNIGVTCRESDDEFGQNERSWRFVCSEKGCYTLHNNRCTDISSHCSHPSRLGIYLDHPAGVLSFCSVSSDDQTRLHTFREKFTQEMFAVAELQPNPSAALHLNSTTKKESK